MGWLFKFDRSAGNYGMFNFEKVLYHLMTVLGFVLFFGGIYFLDYISRL